MADAVEDPAAGEEPPKKKKKLPLFIGLFLMVALGGGGFYATFSGLILGSKEEVEVAQVEDLPAISFVPVAPLTIALGEGGGARFLRFAAQLEVNETYVDDVTHILPRIQDVMNGYLRAVEPNVLQDATALIRIKAQLLRRIQLVSGDGRVRDLLVTEFVVN